MLRNSTFALIALAAVLAAFTYSTGSRGIAATPKPTPVALQYDEITRMAVAPNTPAPPGSFHDDFVAAMNAPAQETQIDPEAAAAMSRLGIKMPNIPGLGAVHPIRYAFYRGWIRVDDLLAKTAEIRKCDVHQYISLDLDKKTYHISDTSSGGSVSSAGYGGRGRNEGPGTAVLTVSRKSTNLGAMTLDGIPTKGYDLTNSMSMTQATGSCQNANFSSSQTEYVSQIRQPQTFCQLPNAAMGMGSASGGCNPTFKAEGSGGGPPMDRLVMYSRTQFAAGGGEVPASVLERGNVRWLFKPEAEQLFSIPPGFTQQ